MGKQEYLHGHPDREAALEAGTINAVNYGTMRSGTSLIFTILCEWFPRHTIIKTHAYLLYPPPHKPPIIASYRDFRDAAVSAWRRHVEPGEMMDEESIRHFAAGSHYNAFVLRQYHEAHLDCQNESWPDTLFVRYEDEIFDIPALVRRIAAHVGVEAVDADDIASRHGIDQHKREADGEVPRPPNAPWMFGHVHDGAVGCWERFTPEPLRNLFTELLSDDLSRWGYI